MKNIMMKLSFFRISAVCALLSASLSAVAADIVIFNATVFDGTGRDPVPNASVLIEKGRIKRVELGKTAERAPIVIDAGGKTVMPGLINGHFHLFFDFYSGLPGNPAGSDEEAREYIRKEMPVRLKAHLSEGITSIFSPIDFGPHIFNLKRMVAKGEILGPRLFVAGPILMHSGGHYACAGEKGSSKDWCNERISLPMDTSAQARESVRALVKQGADVIVFDAISNQPVPDVAVLKAAVDEAHRHKRQIVPHNVNARDVPALLEAGIDGFIHPPSVTRDNDGTLLAKAGERHLPLPVTLGFFQRYIAEGHAQPKDIKEYETQLSNVQLMLKAGAVPIFASDMPGLPPKEVVPTVTRVMSGVGLDNKAILLSATRNVARRILSKNDMGTLEPGQLADLIMVDGDPLADLSALTKVALVIKDGAIVVDKRVK